MREINLNGYIDEEDWWDDTITPKALHDLLYGEDGQSADDVHIRLNSYGGSCNAAVRMFDDIKAYPGKTQITISGTAASAATVLAQGAGLLEITPGSLFMIHDPSTIAMGNERDMQDAINVLRACKSSILNVYGTRSHLPRDEVAKLMAGIGGVDGTWMDANEALEKGFVDRIATDGDGSPENAASPRTVNRKDAEAKVQAWFDRHNPAKHAKDKPPAAPEPKPDKLLDPTPAESKPTGVPIDQLYKRLNLIKE